MLFSAWPTTYDSLKPSRGITCKSSSCFCRWGSGWVLLFSRWGSQPIYLSVGRHTFHMVCHYILKRYLDDCFIIWNNTDENLPTFHTILNSLQSCIKFTIKISTESIPFLDILVCKEETKISSDIYYKPTKTHQYLNFHSCHPSHMKKRNIPYFLARRICTIVVEPGRRNKRQKELESYLREQDYPNVFIQNGIQNAISIPLSELRAATFQQYPICLNT